LVAGTRLFRSADRGTTWAEKPLPPNFGTANPRISFVDEREGWLAMIGSPATQCQIQRVGLIAHTADGGATWESLTPSGIADGLCKDALAFVDPTRGFLDAWSPNQAPFVYRTTDRGRTWTASAALPDPPGFKTQGAGFTLRPGPVRAFDSTLLLAANGLSNGTPFEYVFRSNDGGASWTYLATAQSTGASFAFLTATRWLRIGAPGESVETTDAGASWHAFATDYAQAAPVAPEIEFGDPQTGYATVRGQLKRTLDGGAHWADIKTPGTG